MNPQMIELALAVVLKYAPQLYLDFVEIFSKAEPTEAEKAALTEKLVRLMNPESYYTKPRL